MKRCLLVSPLLTLLWACQPKIGDGCATSGDCSVNGDRVCDVAQPNGYCSVRGCDADTCPDSAICVEFRGEPERIADTWCMSACGTDGDCREGEGYACIHPGDERIEDDNGDPLAEILDEELGDTEGFCVALFSAPEDS